MIPNNIDSTKPLITEINAKGLLGEFDYQIPFYHGNEGRMQVIYAENGRGKTSLLRAINCIISTYIDSIQELAEIPFLEIEMKYDNGAKIRVSRKDDVLGELSATIEVEGEETQELTVETGSFRPKVSLQELRTYRETLFKYSPGSFFLGADRLTNLPRETVRKVTNLPFGLQRSSRRDQPETLSSLMGKIESRFNQIAALSGQGNDDTYLSITNSILNGTVIDTDDDPELLRKRLMSRIDNSARKGELYEKYGLISLQQVKNILEAIQEKNSNNPTELKYLYTVINPYLDSIDVQLNTLNPALQLIDKYVNNVNSFFDLIELMYSPSKGISLNRRKCSSDKIEIDNLSSGEKHLLILLTETVLLTSSKPLIIIDEPEISLGIRWQREIIPALLECSESSNLQFLLASHSVQILNSFGRDRIIRPSEA